MNNVLEVKDLKTYFLGKRRLIKAVDGISFSVPNGKTIAILGESGSGKSITAHSIMRLIPKSIDKTVSGQILFQDKNLLEIPEKEMVKIRGKFISMIFQEPMTSLNPVMKIGDQIKEVAMFHEGLNKHEAKEKTVEILGKLAIQSPGEVFNKYPYQMSGGMKQRIMIAMAIICTPRLLIADEPTTSLDVTIQALIIDIIKKLQRSLNMSIIFISHDLGVVAEVADYIAVMYDGKLVEQGEVKAFFSGPKHPYAAKLLESYHEIGVKKQ